MRRARAAGSLQLIPQRGSRTMEAHSGVPRGQAERIRDGSNALLTHIHATDQLRILGLEVGNEIVHARADNPLQIRSIDRVRPACRLRESVQREFPCGVVAVVVRDRVPQQAIEPSDGALLISNLPGPLHSADKRVLQYLFRILAAANPSAKEVKEPAVVGKPPTDDAIRIGLGLA